MQTLSEIETCSFVHTAMKYYKITKGKRHTVLHCHFSVCNASAQMLLCRTSSFAVPDRVGQTQSKYNTSDLEKKQNANRSSPVTS